MYNFFFNSYVIKKKSPPRYEYVTLTNDAS